ncbi:transcription repressor OFP1-like [Zingiber officinale]|uniref:Transcription repressor n=1 Tax=Zingiber officinale TaxID=94328 RepID=A0A8J5HSN6_ZINOF|nr:transcription repressor OFP1-like [Zingiber officinale]KAG6530408.1 hypothetical protein ZIOFF_012638 [Zingiber officinale]
MQWRRNQKPNKEAEKRTSDASPSSFSLARLLPFSWFGKLNASASKFRRGSDTAEAFAAVAPPPSPCPPTGPMPRSASARLLAFSDRFPPPPAIEAPPRRASLGGEGKNRAGDRSDRHRSVGDIELTLGHIIPFSRREAPARRVESESGSEASGCDLGIGRRRPLRLRRRRRVPPGDSSGLRDAQPRRSISGKIRQRPKVKVRSPRPAAARAEVEGTRMAASSAAAERRKRNAGLERFAVVKCSCDPQRDFKESMVEMIWQKGIGRPEELESLLACYLSLNSDEHHDVIVKVFRQVWFELNPERLLAEPDRQRC